MATAETASRVTTAFGREALASISRSGREDRRPIRRSCVANATVLYATVSIIVQLSPRVVGARGAGETDRDERPARRAGHERDAGHVSLRHRPVRDPPGPSAVARDRDVSERLLRLRVVAADGDTVCRVGERDGENA